MPMVCVPYQVYGAVARSSNTAASRAGRLPGPGAVPQALRARSAAGAQGNVYAPPYDPGKSSLTPWDTAHPPSQHSPMLCTDDTLQFELGTFLSSWRFAIPSLEAVNSTFISARFFFVYKWMFILIFHIRK